MSVSSRRPAMAWRYAPFLAWPVVAGIALLFRVPLAIDETRYLTVAWEMFSGGDWLVPHLNGDLYTHKPPLLFWMIAAGWKCLGVVDWWPRLLPWLLSAAGWAVLWRLCRRLWPEIEDAPPLAVSLAAGTLLWSLTGSMIMFDVLLTLFTLLGMLALANAAAGVRRAWVLFGVALGLAILAKGPVALLHLLLPALAGPWWSERARTDKRRWYLGLLLGVALAAAVALAWVVPAIHSGGDAYAQAILWNQTADRLTSSFAHRRPFWWYVPLLPLFLLPWVLWQPALRGLRHSLAMLEPGTRFCLAWLVPVFVAFSLISGKQPQYLLPVVPAIILLAARGLATSYAMSYRGARVAALAPLMLLALVMSSSLVPAIPWHSAWLEDLHPAWIAALWMVLAWAALPDRVTLLEGSARLSVAMLLGLAIAAAGLLGSVAGRAYGVGPAAREVAAWQGKGTTVAYFGDYHGQLGFAGRLQRPLPEIWSVDDLRGLAAREASALVLVESRANPLAAAPQLPVSVMLYRTGFWSLWPVARLAAEPRILDTIGARGPARQDESAE